MSSTSKQGFTVALLSLVLLLSAETAVMAQPTEAAASSPKQVARDQRKADRKVARAKKNAELSKLEKNGYTPAGNQLDYPQNIQNAEKKAGEGKAASTP